MNLKRHLSHLAGFYTQADKIVSHQEKKASLHRADTFEGKTLVPHDKELGDKEGEISQGQYKSLIFSLE